MLLAMRLRSSTLALGATLAVLIVMLVAPIGKAEAGGRHYGTYEAPRTRSYYRRLKQWYLWGPAEMPPTPRDFGPHFDFQPAPLSGGLNHDYYPH
jgi:hypothetical protein